MSLQAVFFDMGGTIETFGWTPGLRIQQTAGLQKMLAQAGINLGLSDLKLYEMISAGLAAYHHQSLQTMEELPSQRVWNDFIFAGQPVDREKIARMAEDLMFYLETHYYQRAMRPEVPGVLESIRQMGLKIGLISNVNSRGQVPANLEAYGIRAYFDPLVQSSVYGRRKPDPAIFHHAARLAGVPTSACIYVGDRIARDILGARQAGFLAAIQILHDYDHQEEDAGAAPDAVITDMTQLVDIIKDRLAVQSSTLKPGERQGSGVRALIFDAGDILYFRPERNCKWLAFLKDAGLADRRVPDGGLSALRQQAFHGSLTQDEYREAVLDLYAVEDPDQRMRGKQAMDEDDNNVQFFEGVPETLLELKKRGFLLGIITDTANPLHVKLKWFEKCGIVHVWDSIISSQELGIQKPAPGIYAASLNQLGLSACQAAFIGHDRDELEGAQAVGIKTIAFNSRDKVPADFHIEQFADLLAVPIISAE